MARHRADWVSEVISPRTETIDRGRKLRIYAREGVGHMWLVNPLAKTLELYRLSNSKWVLLQTSVDDEVIQAEPFGPNVSGLTLPSLSLNLNIPE